MFERFTEQARQVVVLAQDEARTLRQKHIGTEHLLLGLLREGSVAGIARPLGLTYEEVRGTLDEGDEAPPGQLPFTPNAKKALELSLREALNLSDNFIAPAHILLGLLRADPTLFAGLGVDEGDVRHLAQLKRFTQRGQRVLELAEQEARALRHNYVGTEHILLGLLTVEEGFAARVLASLDVPVEAARAQVSRIVGPGDEELAETLPLTPRSKKVLELALREALGLGHNYIGTEHILLGLVRENEGVAARILLDFGVDAERVRQAVFEKLGAPARRMVPKRTFLRSRPPRGWEYRLEKRKPLKADRLNELGADGWELVAVQGDKLIFKRPR